MRRETEKKQVWIYSTYKGEDEILQESRYSASLYDLANFKHWAGKHESVNVFKMLKNNYVERCSVTEEITGYGTKCMNE